MDTFPIIYRSPDEIAEYAATMKKQQAAVERIMIRESNRINDLIERRSTLGPYGVRTYNTTEEFITSLEDDIHHIEPTC